MPERTGKQAWGLERDEDKRRAEKDDDKKEDDDKICEIGDGVFKSVEHFMKSNSNLGSSIAIKSAMKDIKAQKTLDGIFTAMLKSKQLDMNSSIHFALMLNEICVSMHEEEGQIEQTFDMPLAFQLIKDVFDISYEDYIMRFIYDSESEEEDEDESDKKRKK